MNLKDRTIIITGASSGIGEATAKNLASNGANVVLMARSKDKLNTIKDTIETNGVKALVVDGDVTQASDFENAVSKTVETFGNVDGYAIHYALSQPKRVNINDVYIVPSEQQ